MANEIRVRSAVLAGTITDNPLLVGATSFTSARLADVPAIGTTEHYPIVLDPLGANGAPEVAWITAHTASATSATITRAREGTSARQHPSGTTWYHGPTVNDYIRSVTTAPSGGGLPFDGQMWYHQSEKRFYLAEAGASVRVAAATTTGRTGGLWTRATNLAVANGTEVTITFDGETTDSDGYLTPTSGTVTIPAGLGGDHDFDLNWTYSGNPGTNGLYVFVNGTRRHGYALAVGTDNLMGCSGPLLGLAAGDTVIFKAIHNNGGSLNINPATLRLRRTGV